LLVRGKQLRVTADITMEEDVCSAVTATLHLWIWLAPLQIVATLIFPFPIAELLKNIKLLRKGVIAGRSILAVSGLETFSDMTFLQEDVVLYLIPNFITGPTATPNTVGIPLLPFPTELVRVRFL